MGGQLQLAIDGDLFKATVWLPLAETSVEPANAAEPSNAANRLMLRVVDTAESSNAVEPVGPVDGTATLAKQATGKPSALGESESTRSNIRRIAERKRLPEPVATVGDGQVAGQ